MYRDNYGSYDGVTYRNQKLEVLNKHPAQGKCRIIYNAETKLFELYDAAGILCFRGPRATSLRNAFAVTNQKDEVWFDFDLRLSDNE